MANHIAFTSSTIVKLPIAYVCPQGNTASRKSHDPSGFVLQSPSGTKTFGTIKAAVAWGVAKGYQVKLVQKATADKFDACMQKVFSDIVIEVVEEQAAKAAEVEDEDEVPQLQVGAVAKHGKTYKL